MTQPKSRPGQTQSGTATKAHPFQHGAIGLAAVAAAAQQIKPKEIKRPSHPLPACLRDQD